MPRAGIYESCYNVEEKYLGFIVVYIFISRKALNSNEKF